MHAALRLCSFTSQAVPFQEREQAELELVKAPIGNRYAQYELCFQCCLFLEISCSLLPRKGRTKRYKTKDRFEDARDDETT